jgi:hypothetical protein
MAVEGEGVFRTGLDFFVKEKNILSLPGTEPRTGYGIQTVKRLQRM